VRTFRRFFSAIFLSLMFLNIQIGWIILKTYDQQFTLTTKKSLPIIFKALQQGAAPVRYEFRLGCTKSGALWRNLANTNEPSVCGGDI